MVTKKSLNKSKVFTSKVVVLILILTWVVVSRIYFQVFSVEEVVKGSSSKISEMKEEVEVVVIFLVEEEIFLEAKDKVVSTINNNKETFLKKVEYFS